MTTTTTSSSSFQESAPLLGGTTSTTTSSTEVHHRNTSHTHSSSCSSCSEPLSITSPAPSVPQDSSSSTTDKFPRHHGEASVGGTVLNLMKTCMGTGCLALPFACQQGGIVLYTVGLAAIAAWNVYSVQLLIKCLEYIPKKKNQNKKQPPNKNLEEEGEEEVYLPGHSSSSSTTKQQQQQSSSSPPDGTGTVGIVACYAFGQAGLHGMDACQVLLLLGVTVSYISAAVAFMEDVLGHHYKNVFATITFLILASIASLVPDVGALAKGSASGLLVLLITFIVIAAYGVYMQVVDDDTNDDDDFMVELLLPQDNNNTTNTLVDAAAAAAHYHLYMWPASLSGICDWFGIAVFGCGIVPLTYAFQESMQEPSQIVPASAMAMTGVASLYIIAGIGLYALFPTLTGDVLHELPDTGWIPLVIRIAMTLIVFVTAPLIAVPCAEIIEGKIFHHDPSISTNNNSSKKRLFWIQRCVARFGLVGFCTLVAVALPGFVQVLSLVGCFCVATVSFCMPPLLHLRLVYLVGEQKDEFERTSQQQQRLQQQQRPSWLTKGFMIDFVLLVWGIIATALSTVSTLRQIQAKSASETAAV